MWLAWPRDWAYVLAMALPLLSPNAIPSAAPASKAGRVMAYAGAALGAVVLLGALALWFRYGTAVFFETIAAGISGCL